MYLLSINEVNTVTGAAFVEDITEPPIGSVEVSWANYLTIVGFPTHPYKYENGELLKLDAPSAYHVWSNYQWVIDEANLTNIRKDIWEDSSDWWCSELVAYLLKKIGMLLNGWGRKENTYTPQMCYEWPQDVVDRSVF